MMGLYENLVFLERAWLLILLMILTTGLFFYIGFRWRKIAALMSVILIFLLCFGGMRVHKIFWISQLGTEDEVLAVNAYKNYFAHQDFDDLTSHYQMAKNSNEQCWIGIAMCHVDVLKAERYFSGKSIEAPFCKLDNSEISLLAEKSAKLSGSEFCVIAREIANDLAVKYRQSIESDNFQLE